MHTNVDREYYESLSVEFTPNINKFRTGNRREHCIVDKKILKKLDLKVGAQIRIIRPSIHDNPMAIYTIIGIHEENLRTVFVGYSEPEDLKSRLDLNTTESFTGNIDSQVITLGISEKKAKEQGEFIELLKKKSDKAKIAILAPHGGDIERYTDDQAKYMYDVLSSDLATSWVCKGFRPTGGAFDRWHITSTEISEESFPGLKSIIKRQFKYAIAFHGWKHDDICIGGSMSTELKKDIKHAILKAISDSKIQIHTDYEKDCIKDFNGDNPRNIVNRLSSQSLQIEQSVKARKNYGIKIAQAIVNVLDPLLVD